MNAGHDHDHAHGAASERALWQALALTGSFLVVEVLGALLTGSLALLSDAAHMFTDTAALAIAVAAVRISRRPADARRTYGYYRFEILAAALNAVVLFLVALYILYEAWQRLRVPQEIHALGMLAVAAVGLVVNLIAMRLLAAGKDSSLNVRGAYLEVWSDMLSSLGVIVGAVLVHFAGWTWVDPVIAVAIGLWILPRTWQLLRTSLNILLEGVPDGLELAAIEAALLGTPGVRGVHDLHVWAITSGKTSLTAHLVLEPGTQPGVVNSAVRQRLAASFDIHHTTLESEFEGSGEGHPPLAY